MPFLISGFVSGGDMRRGGVEGMGKLGSELPTALIVSGAIVE